MENKRKHFAQKTLTVQLRFTSHHTTAQITNHSQSKMFASQ